VLLFDYQKGGDSSGPWEMLFGLKGILQKDGYTVYESLYGNHPDILLTFYIACLEYLVDTFQTLLCQCTQG